MDNALKALLKSCRKGRRAVFNTGPFLSTEWMWQQGLVFNDILRRAEDMAAAALFSFEVGFDATVLPFDLNVEAEAMGAVVRYHDSVEGNPVYPTIADKWVRTADDIPIPEDLADRGRLPEILRCIQIVKDRAAGRGAVGVFLPGPFTLAGQVMDIDEMFVMVLKKPAVMDGILGRLADFLAALRRIYIESGVDFMVLEDGGGTAISPKVFRKLLLPHLKAFLNARFLPHILSLTGSSDKFIPLMLECRPDGIGVDQECDIDAVRAAVPVQTPLFAVCGRYDLLAKATPAQVREAAAAYLNKGVDGPVPPADIYPPARLDNIRAFVETVRQYTG